MMEKGSRMYGVSKQFHEKYYDSMYDRLVKITFKDGSEHVSLEQQLTSFLLLYGGKRKQHKFSSYSLSKLFEELPYFPNLFRLLYKLHKVNDKSLVSQRNHTRFENEAIQWTRNLLKHTADFSM